MIACIDLVAIVAVVEMGTTGRVAGCTTVVVIVIEVIGSK